MLRGMHPVHILQILNHYTSRQELDPGFDVLDNSANERPDWYEYFPIRKFLLSEPWTRTRTTVFCRLDFITRPT
jgi:hypothetical protein